MKKELEQQLYEKYPKKFADKDKNMQESCMCWGIECPDSWYWLLSQFCGSIQSFIDSNKKPQVVATQVKEKYGGLRFYYNGGDDYVAGMIWFAEDLSYSICADCGSTEEVTPTKGWIRYLCKECINKI